MNTQRCTPRLRATCQILYGDSTQLFVPIPQIQVQLGKSNEQPFCLTQFFLLYSSHCTISSILCLIALILFAVLYALAILLYTQGMFTMSVERVLYAIFFCLGGLLKVPL